LTANALGYILELSHLQGFLRGISLPMEEDVINNHFSDDSLLSISTNQELVSTSRDCLAMFFEDSKAIVSDHKIDYWIVGLEDHPP
jgi:hypothetical protein